LSHIKEGRKGGVKGEPLVPLSHIKEGRKGGVKGEPLVPLSHVRFGFNNEIWTREGLKGNRWFP